MTPEQIRRAAEVLREQARLMKDSETIWPSNEWSPDTDAEYIAEHDEMIGLAIALDLLAEPSTGSAAALAGAMKEPKAP
jgi:hypothetical protein